MNPSSFCPRDRIPFIFLALLPARLARSECLGLAAAAAAGDLQKSNETNGSSSSSFLFVFAGGEEGEGRACAEKRGKKGERGRKPKVAATRKEGRNWFLKKVSPIFANRFFSPRSSYSWTKKAYEKFCQSFDSSIKKTGFFCRVLPTSLVLIFFPPLW